MTQALQGYGEVDVTLRAVRREFDEMPGLALTLDQARRLWTLDARTCVSVLNRLVETGYLCHTDAGHYARPSMT